MGRVFKVRTTGAVAVMAAAGLMLGLLWGCDRGGNSLARHATGSLEQLQTPEPAERAPEDGFLTPDGAPTHLADFRGRVVVLFQDALMKSIARDRNPDHVLKDMG